MKSTKDRNRNFKNITTMNLNLNQKMNPKNIKINPSRKKKKWKNR